MTAAICIYCLWCPVDRRIRYIGKSNQPVTRIYHHIHAAVRGRTTHHTGRWIRKLARAGKKPRLRVLSWVSSNEDWRTVERETIAKALAKGWPLTNQSSGGDGVDFLDPADAARAKAARTAGFTPEVCAQMSESIRGAWSDPVKRDRIVAAQRAAAETPERRAALSAAARSRTVEGEARRLAAVKAYWARPGVKEARSKAMRDGLANAMNAKKRST